MTSSDTAGSRGTQSSPQKPPTVVEGKYQLGEELGRGAYGLVYKCVDQRSGEVVAIKQIALKGMSQEALQGLMIEVDLLKKLNHANIVSYKGSFKTRTHLHIVLEYMENGALSTVIKPKNFGVLSEPLVAVYMAQVLKGLQYLHDQGVVHRDIKGANILTTKEGCVKLADFGVATKLGGEGSTLNEKRLREEVVGSPYWMAPEVIEMTSVTPASDIWSVGCLIIEVLTGSPPYFDLNPMSAMFRVVQDDHPPLPSQISSQLQEVLMQCFHKNPEQRPDAERLLQHPWISGNVNVNTVEETMRRTINRRRSDLDGVEGPDAHETVQSVVGRMLSYAGKELVTPPSTPPPPPHTVSSEPVTSAAALQVEGVEGGDGGDSPHTRVLAQHLDGYMSDNAAFTGGREEMPRGETDTPGLTAFFDELLGELPSVCVSVPPPPHHPSRDLTGWMPRLGDPPVLQHARTRGMLSTPGLAFGLESDSAAAETGAGDRQDALERGRMDATAVSEALLQLRRGRTSATATETLRTCRDLLEGFQTHPEWKGFFRGGGGVVTCLEMLRAHDAAVREETLKLLNVLITGNPPLAESLAHTGVLPRVLRMLGGADVAPSMRHEAALFVQQMCFTSVTTAMVVQSCDGVGSLVQLIESNYGNWRWLTHVGVECIWRLMDVLRYAMHVNLFCRLLAEEGVVEAAIDCCGSATSHFLTAKEALGLRLRKGHGGVPGAASRLRSESDSQLMEAHSAGGADRKHATGDLAPPGGAHAALADTYALGKPGSPQHAKLAQSTWMVQRLMGLLLLCSRADPVVKRHMCRADILERMWRMMDSQPGELFIRSLTVIVNLTEHGDAEVMRSLQVAGAIQQLVGYMKRKGNQETDLTSEMQVEAMRAMYNLLKFEKDLHCTVAAEAGLVQLLCRFAKHAMVPPGAAGEEASPAVGPATSSRELSASPASPARFLRSRSISLLCWMCHSTESVRRQLYSQNVLQDILIPLLGEEMWQTEVMVALKHWLRENVNRIQPRLCMSDAVDSLFRMFHSHVQQRNNTVLLRLLQELNEMLHDHKKFAQAIAASSIPAVLSKVLQTRDAHANRKVLEIIGQLYTYTPNPKEFIIRFDLIPQLQGLTGDGVPTVVAQEADRLLLAFGNNQVF